MVRQGRLARRHRQRPQDLPQGNQRGCLPAVIAGLLVALGLLATLDLARTIVDRLARWRHWRVGRWGLLLCFWQRVGEGCLSCGTDYRYVLGHPIRYTGETRET